MHEFGYSYERAKELLQENDKTTAALREKGLKEKDRLERQSHNLRQLGKDNRSGLLLRKSIQLANRAEKLEEEIPEVHVEKRRDIKLSSSEIQSKSLIEIKDVTIKAPDGASLFHIDNFKLSQGDRVVILGPNGSGKSQFLQHLYRAFGDIEGARNQGITINPSMKLGYIDQHMSDLPAGMSIHDYINHEFRIDRQATIRSLVNAGFPMADQNQKIGSLSRGQQARIVLLGMHLMRPNFYIMDEPTNHLDIQGQEQLESEILEHQAASVLVSHDRTFVKNIGTKFFVINNKKLVPIEDPKEYYQVLLAADDVETAGRNFNYKKKPMTYDR